MTAIMNRRALATASAYLRLNPITRRAEIVHGSQVDFILTEVFEDDAVQQQAGGGFITIEQPGDFEDSEIEESVVTQYVPLAENQDMRQLAESYRHWAAPTGGKPIPQTQPMSGKGLSVLVRRAPGTFCLTRAGEVAHLVRGRIVDQFKPLTAADMAQAA
ncbi:hypothetical protein FNV58_01240 (plasmid) [Streptomyces sp. RLB1-9]|uniref:hypothetical protein n=1 Tax=Streptomyces sp. RLB1-9 TaxID=2594454 RepID=UPI0011637218|nr:hypothetical protein [Streptomyces sp. RLB1-9]QDN94986.1 hypothetical protein FNV58_01240 [Streptomyces sp. RLB1-9]